MQGHPGLYEQNYRQYRDISSLCISQNVWSEPTLLSGIFIGILFHHLPRGGEGNNIWSRIKQ